MSFFIVSIMITYRNECTISKKKNKKKNILHININKKYIHDHYSVFMITILFNAEYGNSEGHSILSQV